MSENNKFHFSLSFCIILISIGFAAPAAAYVAIQPAAVGADTLTADRLWATTSAVLALVGVVVGGLALARSAGQSGTGKATRWSIVALAAGLFAALNGGLVLVTADGGPGTGNGVLGGVAALVLGLIGAGIGGLALNRSRRTG